MDNVYKQLKKQTKENLEFKKIFTKEKIIIKGTLEEIYSELVFGEVQLTNTKKR